MYINVKVITNAKKQEFTELSPLYYKAKLLSIPEKGKANKELIELVAKSLNVKKSQVKIINGFASREKLLAINSDI